MLMWLLLDVLVIVECRELWSLPWSELPPPEEGEPPEFWKMSRIPWCSLSPTSSTTSTSLPEKCKHYLTHICEYKHHQFFSLPHQMLPCPGLASNCSTLQVAAEDWVALLSPWGHPGPLAFIFFSMMASAIAQWPSCMVFTVTSTCTVLPAQLTGPLKPSSTSFVFSIEKPLLVKVPSKNRIASPSARTTASVIQSLGQASCNILVISDPLHMWEGGGWLTPPLPKSHSYMDTIMHLIIRGGWVSPWCWSDRECMEGDLLDYMNLKGILGDAPICNNTSSIDAASSIRSWAVSHSLPPWDDGVGEMFLLHVSTHFGSIPMLAHFVDRSLIPM